MFTPSHRINNFDAATTKNAGWFSALIPDMNGQLRGVIDHSSALISQGYTYNESDDTWESWVGGAKIRIYRRLKNIESAQ